MRFQKDVQTVSAKELQSVKLDKHITRRMAVTYDWERKSTEKQKLCDSNNTVLSLLHVKGQTILFLRGGWANAKKFPAQLLQKK